MTTVIHISSVIRISQYFLIKVYTEVNYLIRKVVILSEDTLASLFYDIDETAIYVSKSSYQNKCSCKRPLSILLVDGRLQELIHVSAQFYLQPLF